LIIAALLASGSALLSACTSSGSSPSTASQSHARGLPAAAMKVVNAPEYQHGSWHWDAVDLKTGKTLFAQDENELNFLGSTTKLFTVGTYYDQFGADSTLKTPVYATGARSGADLEGDLVLVGAGDFILGSRGVLSGGLEYIDPDDHVYAYAVPTAKPVAADPLAGLDDLARQVKASGITSVSGDVLVDDTLWNPYETKEGVVTSIMVNDNLLDILVKPGAAAGDPVSVDTRPQTGYFDVVNQATTSASGGESTLVATLGERNRIVVTGTLPLGSPRQDLATFAPSPAGYARALFIEALRRAGVSVDAPLAAATGPLPPKSAYTPAAKVASLTSPPTSVLTKLVTKISHNRGAESLLCLLAVKAGSKNCEDGLATVISTMTKADIKPGTVFVYDGEGSDPASGTPAGLIRWLAWADGQSWDKPFEQGLPDIEKNGKILVKSGLSARPENGKIPALFVAAGQAGYMTTASGKKVAVAVYAINGVYPSVAEGITKDLPNTEEVLKQMQRGG
jgi:D-alanyl-D-alanine carboxypeptidase/D-alanyl-D-alanine-endopeptidase (penicillin-binding protein 4)